MKFIIMTLILFLVACSSKPDIKEFPKSADAKQEITNLELALEKGREADNDLLAPASFQEAKSNLRTAKNMQKDGQSKDEVLEKVGLGQAYIERAQINSEENKSKVEDILAARQTAINANADTLLPDRLRKIDDKLKVETANLENDKEDKLKEKRSDFIAGYSDLELSAIKKFHLMESKFLIDDAVKNGARDLTPKTLAATNKKYKEVDSYITSNRYNTPEIETQTSDLLAEARNLGATIAAARGVSAATPEETAIRMKAERDRLNKTQAELDDEKSTADALAAENLEMSKEQKLNAVYEEARMKFSKDEADVYKQGSNLVIRLRALEFPKSQANLKGENFALLKKVEEVIESFDSSNVIVEGHTDSTGGPKINQQLSEERAEAVKQYLEANASENVSDIESKGFGYEKPLSSNKTASGRAQNRRVDVVIEPVQI